MAVLIIDLDPGLDVGIQLKVCASEVLVSFHLYPPTSSEAVSYKLTTSPNKAGGLRMEMRWYTS